MDKGVIQEFIENSLLKNKVFEGPLSTDTNLISTGIIDSLALIRLVSFVEEKFHIDIDDFDVTPENFNSIDAICNFLSNSFQVS